MSHEPLLEQLAALQRRYLTRVRALGEEDFARQFHPDLSPPGWHLGHCVFTELYWLREVVLGESRVSEPFKELYVPEYSPKSQRGQSLPPRDSVCEWSIGIQTENRRLLDGLYRRGHAHALLRDHFLLHFLIQHYAQHFETLMYILDFRQTAAADTGQNLPPLHPAAVNTEALTVRAGRYRIGNPAAHAPYDNEHPQFRPALDEFHLGRRPVSNAEFLGFMEADGYADPDHWSAAGRAWRARTGACHPLYWRRMPGGTWAATDGGRVHALAPGAPVFGINYHEAAAFARWAGARLPHEYEWEAAAQTGALDDGGTVWEWCANAFHPYPGFAAFPYDGYSLPYFDGKHFVLRGGSVWTLPPVSRPSFRNYYLADKRHIRAGLRLAF